MTNTKLQRWIDLLAALLLRHTPLTFDDIAREVPAYNGAKTADARAEKKRKDSIKRTFERDKKELIACGVPIETCGAPGSADAAYRLRLADFYLPYLSLITARGRTTPSRVDKYGYKALASLTFDADELRAVVEGAARARQLGNAALAVDAEAALRKLAYDLPVDAVSHDGDVRIVPARSRADARTLQLLGEALYERRRVRFDYHGLGSDAVSARVAEPYGLFFLHAHWYLAARDVEKDAVRNFRVSRIRSAKVVSPDRELPDYEIPPAFRLREHARSRQAWELGDDDVVEAVVDFRGLTGAGHAAEALGVPDERVAGRRRFQVRRADAFVRWLLSFSGEAIPAGPPAIVDEFRRQLEATRRLYSRDASAAPRQAGR